MEWIQSPLVIVLALIVIAICITYLAISSQGERVKERLMEIEQAIDPIQCPKCDRWKEMPPISSETTVGPRLDQATGASSVNKFKKTTKLYKCRFCGHTWEENFEERLGV